MSPRNLSGGSVGAAGAASITDLFDTDALLDRLGGRAATTPVLTLAGAELGVTSGAQSSVAAVDGGLADLLADEPVLRLLRSLAGSVDADLDDRADPVVVAALAAGFELAANAAEEAALQAAEAAAEGALEPGAPDRTGAAHRRDTLHVVGGGAGRRLPRRRGSLRAAAVVAGVAIALGGGGFAAAATTDPQHAWGPLKPMVRALHPGWRADVFAAKRQAILRTLERATQQSLAGQPVAAAVSYGTARQQARELPKGPDADLAARLAAVARQLGLSSETAGLSDPASPSAPSAPVDGVLPGAPAPGSGVDTTTSPGTPSGGAAPGSLPPVAPGPAGGTDTTTGDTTGSTTTDPSSTDPGAGLSGSGTSADPGAGTTSSLGDTTGSTNGAVTDPSSAATPTGDSTSSAGQVAPSVTDPGADASPSPSPSPSPAPVPTDPNPGGAGAGVGSPPSDPSGTPPASSDPASSDPVGSVSSDPGTGAAGSTDPGTGAAGGVVTLPTP